MQGVEYGHTEDRVRYKGNTKGIQRGHVGDMTRGITLNLHQLEWFCCACELRSFSKAAEQSFVSRQAFGKAIRGLEDELGIPLFHRDAAGVRPTEFAQIIYPKAKRCVNDYQTVLIAREEYLNERREEIRIALADGVAAALPDDFFESLKAENPYADFLIEKHFATHCLELLDEGRVSFALCSGFSAGLGLRSIPLARHMLYVAAADELVRFSAESCTLADLQNLTFFILGNDFPNDRALASLFESRGLTLCTNDQYRDYDVILKEVKRGHGATVVPANCLDQVVEKGITLIPFPSDTLCWEIDFLYPDRAYSKAGERLIEFMRSHSLGRSRSSVERI